MSIKIETQTTKLNVKINTQSTNSHIGVQSNNFPKYDGRTTVTPNQELQILNTKDKLIDADIIINPIPSNYGLIT